VDGLDEFSNVGDTIIVEFTKNNLRRYTVTPEEMGVRRAKPEEIISHDTENNVRDFLRIIWGLDNSAKKDLALVNAAAGFYIMEKVKTLKEGVELAQSLLSSGKVKQKLEQYISSCGDVEKLKKEMKSAGVL